MDSISERQLARYNKKKEYLSQGAVLVNTYELMIPRALTEWNQKYIVTYDKEFRLVVAWGKAVVTESEPTFSDFPALKCEFTCPDSLKIADEDFEVDVARDLEDREDEDRGNMDYEAGLEQTASNI